MPSAKARVLNAFLRVTTKRRWRAGMDIGEVRARAGALDRRLGSRLLPIPLQEVLANDVPATWYGAEQLALKGTILYLHGGAWCLHLPHLYRQFATRLSTLTGMRVLLPDYRLAPEHPFPAGLDDALAAYRWLVEQGYGARPLYVAGDSAGGNLTAVTLMRARDAGLPLPDCAAMLSPSTDMAMSGASHLYNERIDPMFSAHATNLVPALYCPGADRRHPWLSPLFGDWHGLPPLLFHAGSTEMLLDDSIRASRTGPWSVAWISALTLVLLVGAGEALRLWGVAHIGAVSRTRGDGVSRLRARGLDFTRPLSRKPPVARHDVLRGLVCLPGRG
jgi:acetyl esterase/lipase